nr:PREDICTED: uncharacterized protein LOC105663451 [Megachile rotundata]
MKSNDEKEKCSDSFIDIPCESIPKFTEKLSVESSLSQQLAKAQRILRDYSQTEIASCKQLYRHEKFLEDNESKCTIHHVKSSMKQKRNLQCSSVCKQELFDLSQNYVKK